jgi:hypothetical protein
MLLSSFVIPGVVIASFEIFRRGLFIQAVNFRSIISNRVSVFLALLCQICRFLLILRTGI